MLMGKTMTTKLTIPRPDDWHVHVRDGALLAGVLPHTARQFARAIIMPNLNPPMADSAGVLAYRQRIMAALAQTAPECAFTPLMTLYLTDATDPEMVARGHAAGDFIAAKLYPAHATTGSAHGVTDIARIWPVLERMAEIGMPLLIHGEVTDAHVDVFDREAVFIDRTLAPLIARLPDLRVVFEHITTAQAAAFVRSAGPNVAATITPQHLHLNRNAMFAGGIRPHAYCLPVAKREHHRQALRQLATSGFARVFLGTDSAPHDRHLKEAACGCAGIFNAPYALESYATVFDDEGALDRFEGFAARNGPAFYRLPVNPDTITLVREPVTVPATITCNGTAIVPFHAGETLAWRVLT